MSCTCSGTCGVGQANRPATNGRKTLWTTCRLKGLPKMSAERERIADIDRLIAEHKGKGAESNCHLSCEERNTDTALQQYTYGVLFSLY